jgi:hypothetical protein
LLDRAEIEDIEENEEDLDMQDACFLLVNEQSYLVLRRSTKHGCCLKLRKTGAPGRLLTDESIFLEKNPGVLNNLLRGFVVNL